MPTKPRPGGVCLLSPPRWGPGPLLRRAVPRGLQQVEWQGTPSASPPSSAGLWDISHRRPHSHPAPPRRQLSPFATRAAERSPSVPSEAEPPRARSLTPGHKDEARLGCASPPCSLIQGSRIFADLFSHATRRPRVRFLSGIARNSSNFLFPVGVF